MKSIKISKKYQKGAFLVAALIIGYLFFGSSFKAAVIIGVLIAAAAFSTFYHNYFHGPINFELIKFATVITTVSYGIIPGILTGIASTLLSRIWSSRLDHRVLISLLGITAAAMISAANFHQDIRVIGILTVVAYHMITLPISISTGDSPPFAITYSATNIAFNIAIFIMLGQSAITAARL